MISGWFGAGKAEPPKAAHENSQLVNVPRDRARYGESQRPVIQSIPGKCLCGAVQFEVRSDRPQLVMYCHCSNCQKSSGGPVMTWATILTDELIMVKGADEITEFKAANARRRFCRRCGSPLSFQRDDLDDELDVPLSAMEGCTWRPEMHIWASNAVSWCKVEDSEYKLPRHQQDPATLLRKNQQET